MHESLSTYQGERYENNTEEGRGVDRKATEIGRDKENRGNEGIKKSVGRTNVRGKEKGTGGMGM